jgi:ankyrin repeat protein
MAELLKWASSGDAAIAKELLSAGCAAGTPDKSGQTALDYAICTGSPAVVEAMLAAGARPQRSTALFKLLKAGRRQLCAEPALTKLQLDLIRCNRDSAWPFNPKAERTKAFAQWGQILRTWGNIDASIAAQLLRSGVEVNASDEAGLTPLMVAARSGQIEVARELIRAGADIQARTRNGEDILAQVIKYGARSRKSMPVQEKVSSAGYPGGSAEAIGSRTVLMRQALGQQDAAMLRMLIQSGARPGGHDHAGRTALDFARRVHHTEAIAVLSAL